jgi:uncharacterized membrane protein
MGIGTSVFLVAVGAILRFAVTTTAQGLNIHTIGVILMIAGVAGLAISMFWMTMWADRRRGAVAVERRPSYPPRDPDVY